MTGEGTRREAVTGFILAAGLSFLGGLTLGNAPTVFFGYGLSVFAVFAILYYYRQIASSSPLVAATLGMQLGGAFGNLVDRVG